MIAGKSLGGLMLLLSIVFSSYALGQQALIDFDSALPFATPQLGVPVFAASDPQLHTYFILPNSVTIGRAQDGTLMLGVQHYGITKCDRKRGKGATLSITLRPTIVSSMTLDEIMKAIKASDSKAQFILPMPVSSKLTFNMDSRFLDGSANDPVPTPSSGVGDVAFQVKLSQLGARTILNPAIESSDFLVSRYSFRLRGVQKTSPGQVVEREFNYGVSFSVSCKQYPDRFVDLTKHASGCIGKQKR